MELVFCFVWFVLPLLQLIFQMSCTCNEEFKSVRVTQSSPLVLFISSYEVVLIRCVFFSDLFVLKIWSIIIEETQRWSWINTGVFFFCFFFMRGMNISNKPRSLIYSVSDAHRDVRRQHIWNLNLLHRLHITRPVSHLRLSSRGSHFHVTYGCH